MATLFPPELTRALNGQTGTGPWDGLPPDPERAETVEKGHGRIERRRIATTREIVPYLAWPGLAQVCRIERRREIAGQTSCEVVYALTSLTREQADPKALLALVRRHWAAGTGPSRTNCTGAATSPCARTPAASAQEPLPKRSPPCATQPCA